MAIIEPIGSHFIQWLHHYNPEFTVTFSLFLINLLRYLFFCPCVNFKRVMDTTNKKIQTLKNLKICDKNKSVCILNFLTALSHMFANTESS